MEWRDELQTILECVEGGEGSLRIEVDEPIKQLIERVIKQAVKIADDYTAYDGDHYFSGGPVAREIEKKLLGISEPEYHYSFTLGPAWLGNNISD